LFLAVQHLVDALLLAFDGYPTRLPGLPPPHDVATLQQAKLPVGAPLRSAHQVTTGVQVPPPDDFIIRSSRCEPSLQRSPI
jgi:hypothetical protein